MQTFCRNLQTDRRDGASPKLFFDLSIQFCLNNVTNLHQLTYQSTTTCPTTKGSWITVTSCYPIYLTDESIKSVKQGVALTGRNNTGPPRAAPGELRCICAALQTTDTADRY